MPGPICSRSTIAARRATGLGPALALLLLAAVATGPAWAEEGAEREDRGLPAGSGGSWFAEVQRQIQAAEYEVTWQDQTVLPGLEQAWHAPNRSQSLRTYFTSDGIRVVRRTEAEPSWELKLSLIGYGRDGTVTPVGEARLVPAGNRIDYERGPIVEWYVNEAEGLEQGFTLFGPPEEPESGEPEGPAFLALELGGSLSPVISTDGQAIDFAAPGGARVLHYGQLLVTDAGGRELPARMEGFVGAGARGIRIVFDDAGAAYPVTVDPLLTTPSWIEEIDQGYAFFGASVATAGDVNGDGYSDVIVGADSYDNGEDAEGRAYVYLGSAAGLQSSPFWIEEGDQVGANFGISVGTAGDVNGDGYSDVIVGAYQFDNGETNEGRAYVYHGSAVGPSHTPDWTAESNQAEANFGSSVAAAGDVNGDGYSDVIVGADSYDNGELNEGRAYVYHGSAAGLSPVEGWTAESDQAGAEFGCSAGTAGDVNGDGYSDVIVGAHGYDNGESNEGRAYVYHGSAAGLLAGAAWIAESDQADASFGYSTGTAGDVNGDGYSDVIVGAYQYDASLTDEGRAYVYHGSAAGLSASAAWTEASKQASALYGHSVSTAGDVNGDGYADVIVGASSYDGGELNEGRAFVYHGGPFGLSGVADWTAEPDQTNAVFGGSVSTAGDVNGDGYADVVIGARLYDNGQLNEGRAYAYHGSPAGLSAADDWAYDGDQVEAQFGWSVAAAGDVNGDGYGDVIVGAITYDNGHSNEGAAFVFHGAATGLPLGPAWTAESNQTDATFGTSVSTAGDVNGDGYDDVIVSAIYFSSPEYREGKVFVYHGSPAGLSEVEDWSAEGDQTSSYFGTSVSTAGDVNGDGYADVIIGQDAYENGESLEGRACVYHGSAGGLGETADWTAESDQVGARLGRSGSTAGDVNGDGYADVIVGAPNADYVATNEGVAFVFYGSASGLSESPGFLVGGGQEGSYFGEKVSTAGDVNGDGYSDVVIGSENYEGGELGEGRAVVLYGSSSGLSTLSFWTVEGDQAFAYFGNSVATAGDVNGDGYSDVIIGSEGYDNGQTDEGAAFVYFGSAAGLPVVADWTGEGNQTLAGYGGSVSTAGDVNGDGYSDVIVGARFYDFGHTDEGMAFLYFGNASEGVALTPQQRRVDDLAPIAAGGRSRESGSFRLAALGRTPFGRGRVRLEWEVKPLGQPFDGSGTGQGEWTDTGVTGGSLNELVSGLDPGAQHWRMRLLYDPASTPLGDASRWFSVPRNGWEERDLTVSPFIGGVVWEDRDADGIMESGEQRLAGVLVRLLDAGGTPLQTTVTGGDGSYRFDVGSGNSLRVQFVAPDGWTYTLADQGIDDFVDSDADTATGETALVLPPFDAQDEVRWSAGLLRVGICFPPDEPVYIYAMTLTTDGNEYPVLHFQDPNQPDDVTGYNIYRSHDPGLPHADWPLIADDVIDMDEAEPNKQWVDTSGDEPPGGIWYYQVAAYNHVCPLDTAEGPW